MKFGNLAASIDAALAKPAAKAAPAKRSKRAAKPAPAKPSAPSAAGAMERGTFDFLVGGKVPDLDAGWASFQAYLAMRPGADWRTEWPRWLDAYIIPVLDGEQAPMLEPPAPAEPEPDPEVGDQARIDAEQAVEPAGEAEPTADRQSAGVSAQKGAHAWAAQRREPLINLYPEANPPPETVLLTAENAAQWDFSMDQPVWLLWGDPEARSWYPAETKSARHLHVLEDGTHVPSVQVWVRGMEWRAAIIGLRVHRDNFEVDGIAHAAPPLPVEGNAAAADDLDAEAAVPTDRPVLPEWVRLLGEDDDDDDETD